MKSVLISGSSHTILAQSISNLTGIPLHNIESDKFSNGEIKVSIIEHVRDRNIFIIQTACEKNNGYTINDYLMELILLIDACKRSQSKTITVVIPNYFYSRQDRKDESRVPISAKVVADILTTVGITRFITIDLHSPQQQGFFNCPSDNLYAINPAIDYLHNNIFRELSIADRQKKYIIVSPDAGAVKRTLSFGQKMNLNTVIIHKQRNYKQKNTVEKSILISDEVSIEGKTAIICDDMCDTGGTLIKSIELLKKNGIINVICLITHGVLTGPAIDRINNCDLISHFIVSDTIPQEKNILKCSKLRVFSVAPLLSHVINRISNGLSLGSLFS